MTDKLTKVYNDSIFGIISWSKDNSKIIFIGEKPEPASYKNYWEDEKEEPKKDAEEGKSEEKKEEEKKEAKEEGPGQDSKYLYVDEFGETLTGKKRPTIFIFNLKENKLQEVLGINEGEYPAFPVLDESN